MEDFIATVISRNCPVWLSLQTPPIPSAARDNEAALGGDHAVTCSFNRVRILKELYEDSPSERQKAQHLEV